MLIRHYQGDDLPNATGSYGDEDGWWGGVQQCGAILALAASIVLGTQSTAAAQQVFNYQQDDPAGTLFSGAEEYFWQNPVPPVPSYPVPQVFTDDVVIAPQPVAFQPDEDFWQNPVAPVPLTFTLVSPWQDEQTPLLFPQPDEDFWVSGVAPVPQSFAALYLPDPEQVIVPQPIGQPDEDFWVSGVAPVQLTFAVLYLPDPADIIVPQPIPPPPPMGRSVRFGMSFPAFR